MRAAVKEIETENLFEILANKSPMGLYIVQDGVFRYTNPTFQNTTGYRADELLGRDSLELIVPEDREMVRDNTIKMLKGKLTLPYQFRVTHKNGSIRWVMGSVAPIQYRERRATLGYFVDITERKQVEEALRASEETYKTVVEDAPIGIYYSDFNGTLLYGNKRAEEIVGYKVEDLLGKSFLKLKLLRPEGIAKAVELLALNKLGKATGPDRFTLNKKDGTTSVVEIRTKVIPVGGKKAVLGMVEDITKRKQAEEAQREAEEEKNALLEDSPNAIMNVDLKGKITYVNKRFESESGYSREEIVGKNGLRLDWAPADTMKHLAKRMAVRLRGGPPEHWETQFKCKDGRWIWIEIDGKILRRVGVPVGFQVIARDITKRKQIEEAVQAERNKLQSLINALTDAFNIVDRDYNLIYQNEPAKRPFGDRMGEKCYLVFEGNKKVCEGCPVEKAFKDGKSHTAERRTVTPSGKVIFWENTANPIRDAEGRIVSCLEIAKDITERKQWEQALADEVTRRRILVDQSRDGIVVLDQNGKVYEANQQFAEMLGYTPEEVRELYAWDWEYLYPHERVLEMLGAVDEAGDHFETQHRRKDGSIYDVEISTNGAMCGGQKLIFCVCRDITERKRAAEALQIERNKLQSVIDAMTDALTIQDTEYNIIFQNEPSRKSTGGDRTGEKCYRAYEGRESICEDCPVEKAFKDGKPHTSERQRVLSSGKLSFWENTANPIRDAKGEVVSCLEIGRNITERKKQEQALADELTRRRLLIDQSMDGIVVLDVDAKVYEANQRFADMLGYTLEEVRELHTWDWDKQFPPEKILEMGRNADEKGFHLETKHTRKDGSVIDVDISINAAICAGQKLIFCVGRDVTERKRMEGALQNSEEKLRKMFESATDGISVTDLKGIITEANQRTVEMHSFSSKDELRGKSALELIAPRDHKRIAANMKKIIKQGAIRGVEYTLLRADGSEFPGELSTSVLKDASGNLVGYVTIARDITKRKETEEALDLQRAYFQQLFDNSPDAIVRVDIDNSVVQTNKGFEVLFGYPTEEIKSRLISELIIPEGYREEVSASVRTLLDGEVARKELVRRCKDGRLIDVSAVSYPIHLDGKLVGAYIIYSDITERKQAEEAIKQAAEEWRRTFDSISDAISIHDRDFRILRANKAFADLFRKSPQQIIGMYCYELHKGNKPVSGCPHRQTLATGQPAVAEFYESHIERHLRESTSPIFNEKGETIGTVHIARDITEQKQQSARLMLADRLASLGELAAGTAHELNNPLTSVIGFSQLLMEKDIPDDIREDVKLINNEAQRAAGVTKNLLTFARKHAPVKQLTQINNVIEDVLKLRAYEQKVNSIEVKKQLAPDLPEIMVDYFQMQQVFLNIIINAEYFMSVAHNKGTLTITTKNQNGSVRISFADDGPGIPEENLSRIFDPFFTTKETGKGTGLGLSICHGIVAEHGGHIYARSQLGKGATFVVELPIKSP
jgi:PAS domain S-box-containing protein